LSYRSSFGLAEPIARSSARPPKRPIRPGLLRTEHRHEKSAPFDRQLRRPPEKELPTTALRMAPLQHHRHRRHFVVQPTAQHVLDFNRPPPLPRGRVWPAIQHRPGKFRDIKLKALVRACRPSATGAPSTNSSPAFFLRRSRGKSDRLPILASSTKSPFRLAS